MVERLLEDEGHGRVHFGKVFAMETERLLVEHLSVAVGGPAGLADEGTGLLDR